MPLSSEISAPLSCEAEPAAVGGCRCPMHDIVTLASASPPLPLWSASILTPSRSSLSVSASRNFGSIPANPSASSAGARFASTFRMFSNPAAGEATASFSKILSTDDGSSSSTFSRLGLICTTGRSSTWLFPPCALRHRLNHASRHFLNSYDHPAEKSGPPSSSSLSVVMARTSSLIASQCDLSRGEIAGMARRRSRSVTIRPNYWRGVLFFSEASCRLRAASLFRFSDL